VRGIDASPWAILRRLGRGWLGHGDGRHIVDARDVVYLRGNPDDARQQGDEHDALAQLRPAEIAGLAEALPYLHAAELMVLFPARRAASVFKRLSRERQIQVLGELDDETGVGILAEMSADQVADVLGRLRPAQAHRILELLPDEQAELIGELLRYPADTAGGIMTNEVVVVPGGITVAEAIEIIREKLTRPNPVYVVYVVDDVRSCRLEGTLSFRDLLVAEREWKVEDVMTRDLIVAGPVVAPDRRLLGVVTLDSAIAQIAPATIHRDLPKVFA
jgi:magnesium transporter